MISLSSVGTLGQPKIWDISNPVSYQHPMAPYDVLVDPQTLPKLPKDQSDVKNKDDDAKDSEKETEVWKYFLGAETGHLQDDSVSLILLQQTIRERKQRRPPRQWKRR